MVRQATSSAALASQRDHNGLAKRGSPQLSRYIDQKPTKSRPSDQNLHLLIRLDSPYHSHPASQHSSLRVSMSSQWEKILVILSDAHTFKTESNAGASKEGEGSLFPELAVPLIKLLDAGYPVIVRTSDFVFVEICVPGADTPLISLHLQKAGRQTWTQYPNLPCSPSSAAGGRRTRITS